MSTTASTARNKLFEKLRDDNQLGAASPALVTVTYGHPGKDLAEQAIWVGGIQRDQDFRTTRSSTPREEIYVVVIGVSVGLAGDSAKESADRVVAISDRIDELVKADPKLGATVTEAKVVHAEDLPFMGDSGWCCDGEVHVRCSARI